MPRGCQKCHLRSTCILCMASLRVGLSSCQTKRLLSAPHVAKRCASPGKQLTSVARRGAPQRASAFWTSHSTCTCMRLLDGLAGESGKRDLSIHVRLKHVPADITPDDIHLSTDWPGMCTRLQSSGPPIDANKLPQQENDTDSTRPCATRVLDLRFPEHPQCSR